MLTMLSYGQRWALTLKFIRNSGITAGSFGAVAGFFALFFFSDVPKVRKDIMQVRKSSTFHDHTRSIRERL